ncbi:hypothetical protein PUN28_005840 [Cardiocondyla obscurior]|uniref:Uncharacterized protein n=1 Tax=Cardiocondyla obscurior TaxID=286306 RepID=A0AAW2G8Q9_9HYME
MRVVNIRILRNTLRNKSNLILSTTFTCAKKERQRDRERKKYTEMLRDNSITVRISHRVRGFDSSFAGVSVGEERKGKDRQRRRRIFLLPHASASKYTRHLPRSIARLLIAGRYAFDVRAMCTIRST